MVSFISNSPDETFQLGREWAADVAAGWVIGLMGDLGTGKTQLVKGLAAGLGIEAIVNSPTFALLQEHNEGRLPLAHIDLYRLESQSEIVGAGLEHFPTAPTALPLSNGTNGGWLVAGSPGNRFLSLRGPRTARHCDW